MMYMINVPVNATFVANALFHEGVGYYTKCICVADIRGGNKTITPQYG